MQSLCDVRAQAHHMFPKIALPWGSQLRWRSVLQSEAAINFYKYEDEEVISPKSKKMLLIVPQMNRVL